MHALCLPAALALFAAAAEPGPREIKGTELIVQAELDQLEAPEGDVAYQPSEALAAAFPGYMFVLASFPDVDPKELPEPLAARNLYAVSPDGEPKLLATPDDVLDLFKDAFDPVKTAEDAKKAAAAALALEAAKFPEQPFTTPPDGLMAKPDGNGGFTASGTSQPGTPPGGQPAGSGPISVNLGFGSGGRPSKVVTVNNYKPPARRRRQVTPADIAADAPAAQKVAGGPVTNINSPTINKTIPGSTFYTSPGGNTPNSKRKGNKGGVVAVDPGGKASNVGDNTALARYVRRQFGPVTTQGQAKELMESYLTLATGNFPDFSFAPVKDKDITVTMNSDGGLTVSGRVYVKGDEKKFFHAKWTFNAKGKFTGGGHGNRGLRK